MSMTLAHFAGLLAAGGVSITVRYRNEVGTLIAVPAASEVNLFGADGSYTTTTIADWLMLVADWPLKVPPQKGVEIAIGSEKYLVAHPDEKQPVYRNFNQLDRPALAWRVHSVPR